jgi:ABC transport system ATP-binding/permease protein
VNYLSVEDISKSFGERQLFSGLTFGIAKGEKIALIAKNGTGKSTMLNILYGSDTPDTGRVVFNNDIRQGFLAQEHGLVEDATVIDNLFMGNNRLLEAVREYENIMASNPDAETMQRITDVMDQNNAWDYEAKSKQILGKLGIQQLNKLVSELSGGQKRRVALAKVLIEEPDFLLLDEPTNHLDLEMIEWLEDYLVKTNMTLLMVTHDRYFLEVVCNEILELDNNTLYRYKGGYSYFLEKKGERQMNELASRDKAQNLMRRELVWMRSTPKARTTKSKHREGQFDDLKKAATVKLEDDELKLEINIERLGSKVVEFHKVKMAYGDLPILKGFDYMFKRNERVGLAGKNGTGKTTILNLITGLIEPNGGKVTIGETVKFGYYSQSGLKLNDEHRVIDVVREIADVIPLMNGKKITAEQMLERFLFPRSAQRDFVYKLSGGEKKRLHLLTVLMENPNFLILDEPTNDLDVFTLSILEDYLLQFPGVLVIVSHDRFLLDKLCDHILVLKGDGTVKDILGNYSTWRQWEEDSRKNSISKNKPKQDKPKEEKVKTKMSFKEKFEFDALEEEIPKLEKEKELLEDKLNSGETSDHEELLKISQKLARIVAEIEEKSDRWLELSEWV